MSKQIEAQDGWPIGKVAEFLNLSKSTLYIWSCYDRWGGKYPPAPKRIGRRLVWDPREVIDYRNNRCAITRKELVHECLWRGTAMLVVAGERHFSFH